MANTSNKKIQDLAPKAQTESGVIRVHESVVSSIVRKAVLGINGVLRFAGNSLVDNIAEFVGSKSMLDRAISIEMGENSVSLDYVGTSPPRTRVPPEAFMYEEVAISPCRII